MEIKINPKAEQTDTIIFLRTKEQAEKENIKDFKGKDFELHWYYDTDSRKFFVGLGEEEKVTKEKIRKAVYTALEKIQKIQLTSLTVEIPKTKINEKDSAVAITESIILGDYSFEKYKTDKEKLNKKIEKLYLIGSKELQEELLQTQTICNNTLFARDLANEQADIATPSWIARKSKEIAMQTGLRCTVLDEEDLKELKLGLILGVGKGSINPPRLIILEHIGDPKSKEKIVLVGKGITYDTGGLYVKTSWMEEMKIDMHGAATAFATVKTCAELNIKKNVTAVLTCAENSVGPNSYRNGDILTSYSGKTVEIRHTDAEGRLVLADAMEYAEDKLNPSLIISMATLTGACIRALSDFVAGIMSNEEDKVKQLIKSGEETYELLWQLPLFEEYMEDLKSEIADIPNLATKHRDYAGAQHAAMFLKSFIKKVPYIHLDIAGPTINTSRRFYISQGGTGYGVRLLIDFLKSN